MQMKINLTRRVRRRKLMDGTVVRQTRYVLNYREPKSGQRRQEFFERQKDAQERRADLIGQFATGGYVDERKAPTVAEVLDHWLDDKTAKVKASTAAGYGVVVRHIRGPILVGTAEQRVAYAASGRVPKGTRLLPMLGAAKSWHREVADHAGVYTANRAASHLRSILALAEEDFGSGRRRCRITSPASAAARRSQS